MSSYLLEVLGQLAGGEQLVLDAVVGLTEAKDEEQHHEEADDQRNQEAQQDPPPHHRACESTRKTRQSC